MLVPGVATAETLRRSLTEPVDLGADVVEWLGLVGVRLTPKLRELVAVIFGRAGSYGRIASLLRDMHWSDRSARSLMHKRGLAPPEAWFLAARAIHAALRLQAEPCLTATRVALEMGYAGHSRLSRVLRRLFAVGVQEARSILGWEPLVDRCAALLVPNFSGRCRVRD